MQIKYRQSTESDAQAMVDIINPIIEAGGTTAYTEPYTVEKMIARQIARPSQVSSLLACEDDAILAYQCLYRAEPSELPYIEDPDGFAIIASFARIGIQGKGIGMSMIEHTKFIARTEGFRAIDATIRADNVGGLAYYTKCGFEDVARTTGSKLADGTIVDRIHKVYYL